MTQQYYDLESLGQLFADRLRTGGIVKPAGEDFEYDKDIDTFGRRMAVRALNWITNRQGTFSDNDDSLLPELAKTIARHRYIPGTEETDYLASCSCLENFEIEDGDDFPPGAEGYVHWSKHLAVVLKKYYITNS